MPISIILEKIKKNWKNVGKWINPKGSFPIKSYNDQRRKLF